MSTIFIAGTGAFGAAVAHALSTNNHIINGVSAPAQGRHGKGDALANWALQTHTPRVEPTALNPDCIPAGTDIIFTAHSHSYIGKKTRGKARYALGYHPSLLPLHRGRDAIAWTIRMNDKATGGTIYHLSDNVDGGPIALQQHVLVPPGSTPSALWRDHLFPLGVEMALAAANLVDEGALPYTPQNEELATWEPSLDTQPLFRPELPELP